MGSTATTVATGLHFGEAPRWRDGRLWFSDFYAHAVKTLDDAGNVDVVLQLDDDEQPSGLGWLPDGRLLVVAMRSQRILAWDGSTLAEHADLSGLATFHCNDMVVDALGRAYVGFFGFDLDHEFEQRGVVDVIANHATAAVLRVDPDGAASLAAPDMHFPNGSVITPDGSTLIVAETLGFRLTAFDISADGALSNRRVWADLAGRPADGICLDADGNIWVANPLAPECFLVAEGGEVLDIVTTEQPVFACMLGGSGGRTLYLMTAPTSHGATCAAAPAATIQTTRVAVPHAGRP